MTPQFTPGPWLVSKISGPFGESAKFQVTAPSYSMGMTIGERRLIAEVHIPECREQAVINAVVIAAAPELYKALKAMRNHFVCEWRHAIGPDGLWCEVCGVNNVNKLHDEECPVLKAEEVLYRAGGK